MVRRALGVLLLLLASCASRAQDTGHVRSAPEASARPAPDGGSPSADARLFRAALLGSVRVETAPGLRAGEVEIEINREHFVGEGFGELTRRGAAVRAQERVRADVGKLYPRAESPASQDLTCSFVVDCDEPAVTALVQRFKSTFGDAPTIAQLEQFTSEAIPKKNLSRSFDIASVVARRGEGDCSEHAVLLAAVARSVGIPARVATGLVLSSVDNTAFFAYGHAWVEVYVDGAFRIADAALVNLERETGRPWKLIYLPIALLRDETVSFGASALKGAEVTDVNSVRVPLPGSK